MRISDWSSDVCSSDLLHHHFADSLGLHLTFAAGFKLALDSGDEFFHADRIDRSLAAGDLHGTGQLFAVERLATAFTLDHPKIGRASLGNKCVRTCRSRWAPYP